MIIKGLFRRYERWNPVHPTSGAFWGMGIGIGCGVGWGPGFGPEVIGYVGAGCGVGFSVGFTLVGMGIGLPANFVFEVPYNAIMGARSGALEFTQSEHLLSARNVVRGGWKDIAPRIAGLQREARGRFSSFKENNLFGHMRRILPTHAMSISKGFQRFGSRIFFPQKDAKD